MFNFLSNEGRLEISSEAMKIVAKSVKDQHPMVSLRAGLRHDFRERFPLENVFITGVVWGARLSVAHALARRALCGGFRTIQVIHQFVMRWEDVDINEKSVWEAEDPQEPAILSRRFYTNPAFLLDLRSGSLEEVARIFRKFMSEKFSDPEVTQVFILTSPLNTGPEGEKRRHDLMMLLLEEIPKIGGTKEDTAVFIEDPDYGTQGWKWEALKLFFAFCVSISDRNHSDGRARYGDAWISIEDRPYPEKTVTEVIWGKSQPPEDDLYDPKPGHLFTPPVYRALERMANADASSMTHTQRLDLVARACGYKDWHRAEGRR